MNDKKAKREKIITIIVNISFATMILSLLILPVALPIVRSFPEKNVGIDGCPFMYSTSTQIVKLIYGAPDEAKEFDSFAEETLTYYNKKIFSYEATVKLYFKVNQLREVRAELTVPEGEAEEICNDIREKIRKTYAKSENFFEDEKGNFGRRNVAGNWDYAFGEDNIYVKISDDKVIINAYVLM